MKTIFTGIGLLLGCLNVHASHTTLWAAIHNLGQQITSLQSEIQQFPKPIVYEAGDGIEINGAVIQTKSQRHFIGESYRGGTVFYVDELGQHGLIASKKDIAEQGIQWRNGISGNKITNAKADGIGAGEMNTRLIIAQQTIDDQKGQFAALLASLYQIQGDGITPCTTPSTQETLCYGGWYLPSAHELQLLYHNLHETQMSPFSPEFYWSSTEATVSQAWLINFSTGEMIASSKSNTVGRIRPINSF